MVLCGFLCPGAPECSTGSGSGLKASQQTGPRLKVSSGGLGEAEIEPATPGLQGIVLIHLFHLYKIRSVICFLLLNNFCYYMLLIKVKHLNNMINLNCFISIYLHPLCINPKKKTLITVFLQPNSNIGWRRMTLPLISLIGGVMTSLSTLSSFVVAVQIKIVSNKTHYAYFTPNYDKAQKE